MFEDLFNQASQLKDEPREDLLPPEIVPEPVVADRRHGEKSDHVIDRLEVVDALRQAGYTVVHDFAHWYDVFPAFPAKGKVKSVIGDLECFGTGLDTWKGHEQSMARHEAEWNRRVKRYES